MWVQGASLSVRASFQARKRLPLPPGRRVLRAYHLHLPRGPSPQWREPSLGRWPGWASAVAGGSVLRSQLPGVGLLVAGATLRLVVAHVARWLWSGAGLEVGGGGGRGGGGGGGSGCVCVCSLSRRSWRLCLPVSVDTSGATLHSDPHRGCPPWAAGLCFGFATVILWSSRE